ncbi:unnamed protein product [Bemisia tabaci]|uniref:Uncharacterized protein n=1 Tax=Bemisia tabaci TaxID=7038 RepID=A0A9P0A9X8_BEMTA|nr:unnamed protein product [Bemisia tabaci]
MLLLISPVLQASNTGEKLRKTTFKDVTQTREFIDKSLLIKFILENHWHIYIEAPPGFGRTTNLRMLQEFFSVEVDSNGFFINAKKILQSDENFQNILQKRSGPRNTSTKRVTFETDTESKFVHDAVPLSASTNSLTNYDTFSKPRLRILKEAPELFETYFARHPVLFMDFGKLSTKYYGLTDYDVLELAKRSDRKTNIANIRKWYGGYKAVSKGQNIYKTRSAMRYFKTGVLKSYRFESIKFKSLKTLLDFKKLGRDVEDAFEDETQILIRPNIPQSLFDLLRRTIFSSNQTVLHRSLVLQILLDHGFYTVQDGNRLHVPNFEAMLDIKNLIFDRGYYINKLNIPGQIIDNFVESIERLTGEKTSYDNFLAAVTELFKNCVPRGARELAHTLVTLLADARKFSLIRGQETPENGRQDVLVKRSPETGIVIGSWLGRLMKRR